MTTGSRLCDLPAELFGQVIGHFVQTSRVSDAWITRSVCHLFKDAITYEVVHRLPAESFEIRDRWSGFHGHRILERNLSAIVRSPVRKTKKCPLATFIDDLVDEVMEVEMQENSKTTKDHYMETLATFLIKGGRESLLQLFFLEPEKDISTLFPEPWIKLSSAAAVGSLEAVTKFIAIHQWPNEVWAGRVGAWARDYTPLLDPIVAAVSTGQIHILEHLLLTLEPFVSNFPGSHRSLQERFYAAIGAAITAERPEIIMVISRFMGHHNLQYSLGNSGQSPRFIRLAAKSGCIRICRAVLHILPPTNTYAPAHAFQSLFVEACKYGHANIVQWLLKQGSIDINEHGLEGFGQAATYSQQDVIDTLLDYGGDINRGDIINEDVNNAGPLQAAISAGRVSIMKYMIDCGASITDDILETSDWHLDRLEYKGLRTFQWTHLSEAMEPVTYYLARKWGTPLSTYTYLDQLVDDVEDSKALGPQAEFWLNMGDTRGAPGARLFGQSILDDGF